MFKLTMTTALLYLLYLVVVPAQASAAVGVETSSGWWMFSMTLCLALGLPLLHPLWRTRSR
jgi:hypothetical protein